MATIEEVKRLRERSISKLNNDAALEHIGILVDLSMDARFDSGAERALYLLSELTKRELNPKQGALVEYFRANAWSVKEEAAGECQSWDWEHPYREQQVLALSRAVVHPGFVELGDIRRCQILTNRANQLDTMGRFIDAIEGWDAALSIIPQFALAQANRGYGLKHYGRMIDDDFERAIFLLHAYDGLVAVNAPGAVYDSVYPKSLLKRINDAAAACACAVNLDRIRALQNLDASSLGRSKAERTYRKWCLNHRLFLNPLNDLGAYSKAARDDLVLPPITESFGERPAAVRPPPVIGFFNQMKQEYVSARYMLYEGIHDTSVHFSDRGVHIVDTLDYPHHSYASERIRTAFRVSYSIFDKIALLIDQYWKLNKNTDRINFKSVWMLEGKKSLLNNFKMHKNWPLRGLYWLSKELFDSDLKLTTGADARELHDMRNALEHKYIQVHESWAAPSTWAPASSTGFGLSIYSDLLESRAIRVMKMVRAALIQLALAIGEEERMRERTEPSTILGSRPLFRLEDSRKRRDPF